MYLAYYNILSALSTSVFKLILDGTALDWIACGEISIYIPVPFTHLPKQYLPPPQAQEIVPSYHHWH